MSIVLLGLGYFLAVGLGSLIVLLVRDSKTIDRYQEEIDEYLSSDWF